MIELYCLSIRKTHLIDINKSNYHSYISTHLSEGLEGVGAPAGFGLLGEVLRIKLLGVGIVIRILGNIIDNEKSNFSKTTLKQRSFPCLHFVCLSLEVYAKCVSVYLCKYILKACLSVPVNWKVYVCPPDFVLDHDWLAIPKVTTVCRVILSFFTPCFRNMLFQTYHIKCSQFQLDIDVNVFWNPLPGEWSFWSAWLEWIQMHWSYVFPFSSHSFAI